jgi:hypothetical protein
MTPAAWLNYLEQKLAAQQREIAIFEQYYNGEHRLAFATLKFRQAFGWLFQSLADNWCELVVDAPIERLFVEGFRFGKGKPADTKAWDIWQANGLDSESVMAHTEAVKDGRSYILVGPPEEGSKYPRITVEHASQVIVETEAGNRRNRLAALKKWRDEDGYIYATLYLPNQIVKWRTKEPVKSAVAGDVGRNWVLRPGDEGGDNPVGVVPVIPLENNPTMLAGGRSDLIPAIPLQDAIDKELADMLVASEFAAFPQRVMTGVEVPTDESGAPLSSTELKAAVGRLWVFENENAKVSQFAAADLNNYVNAIAMLLQHLAAQTRTPPHYLLGQIVNVSGDALKAAETGLVAKVKRKQVDFSDSWEEAMRLALKLKDEADPAEALSAETIWRDPEYRSEGEQVDAAIKLRALGIPVEALWERIGASPQEVEEWRKKLDENQQPPMPAKPGEPEVPTGTGVAEPAAPAVSITERTQQ